MGLALFCGVPGTLAAFMIAWPLGLLIGTGAVVAFLAGRHMEQEQDARESMDREEQARRDRARPS